MKKYFLVFVLAIIITPSLALAAWWNPFSWHWKALFTEEKINTVELEKPREDISVSPPDAVEEKPKKEEVKDTSKLEGTIKQSSATKSNPSTQKLVSCNGQQVADTCATGEKFICVADKVGCYSEFEANNFFVCNGKAYLSCETQGLKSICPSTGEPYCAPQTKEKSSAEMYLDELREKEEARVQAEQDRENSSECEAAKKELASISEKQENAWEKYKATSDPKYLSLSADLSIQMRPIESKKYEICDNFYPTPPKTYNTTCYDLYGTINCTTR